MKQRTIIFFCLFSFVLFLITCSSPTSSSKVTYSGIVTLEDTIPINRDVTVSLYASVELSVESRMPAADTALLRINHDQTGI